MTKRPFIPIPPPAPLPEPERIEPAMLLDLYGEGEIDLICVMGPTASGKTKYAVTLAREFNRLLGRQAAEIISADSRQIYIGMDIGTGKDLEEYGEIPCHLVDIIPAGSRYNICRYQKAFSQVWTDCRKRGAVPILCGGSGLYVEAVSKAGYDMRENEGITVELPKSTFYLATLVDRDTRRERIDRRLDYRLEHGLVEEIHRLLDSGIPAEDLIYYGLEYKFVTLYVTGQMSYDDMHEKLRFAIHQFAKRQMTWLRGMEKDGIRIHWVAV